MHPSFRSCLVAWLLATATVGVLHAETPRPGPIFRNLGDHRHAVATSSPRAQKYFDQGLALCFGFNHTEAIRSFRSAALVDPQCAMAYWGVAYASGPHVNKPMTAEDNVQAWAALQEALSRRSSASARDQAYIDALARRYTATLPADRTPLDRAWAEGLREVVRQFPDDLDAHALLAEALMDTMPWDYWTRQLQPKPETEEVLRHLRHVLERQPDHPGANHLYIHAVEAGPQPELGIPSADRLRDSSLLAGHLVHMPSHIYMRVGQYDDAVTANVRATKADQDYLRQGRAQGFYPGVYYPHNLHFLWWAQLFDGRSEDALKTARRAATFALDNYCGPRKALEAPRLRHLPWLTLARFGRWEDLLRIQEPPQTNDFLVDRAVWHFTRGLAFAARQDVAAATQESLRLGELATGDEVRRLDNPNFPVSATLNIANLWLQGRVAEAAGRPADAREALEKAVAAEDAMPYMEPSFWPLPVRPTLGAFYLRIGEPARAETVFREDLRRWRRNPWGLLGLESCLRAQGRVESADAVHGEFERAWQRADVTLNLAWF